MDSRSIKSSTGNQRLDATAGSQIIVHTGDFLETPTQFDNLSIGIVDLSANTAQVQRVLRDTTKVTFRAAWVHALIMSNLDEAITQPVTIANLKITGKLLDGQTKDTGRKILA